MADRKGGQARIYPNDTLRQQVKQSYETAVAWPTTGLPANFYPLLAPNRCAFTTMRETMLQKQLL